MYRESLESFVQAAKKEEYFCASWPAIFPDLCRQLADAVAWLHSKSIYCNDERLNPRDVFITKNEGSRPSNLQITVPDKLNPFTRMEDFYADIWTKPNIQNGFQRDMISVAILIYYILTLGDHPYQVDDEFKGKYEPIKEFINGNQLNYLLQLKSDPPKCFCNGNCSIYSCQPNEDIKNRMICHYRSWINRLAYEAIHELLEEETEQEKYDKDFSSRWMKHPFFWNNLKRLTFLEKASNYLTEIAKNKNLETLFKKMAVDIKMRPIQTEMAAYFPKIMILFQEPPSQCQNSNPQYFDCAFALIKRIRNKVTDILESNSMVSFSI